MSFARYKNYEDYVEATQLTPASQATVVKALNWPATRLELSKLEIVYNVSEGCYELVWRYKDESTDTTLNVGDYLVCLNNGKFTSYTASEFNKQYFNVSVDEIIPAQDQQTVEEAIINYVKAQLGVDVEEITPAIMKSVANATADNYDSVKNIYTIKLSDMGLCDPTGIANVINSWTKAAFLNEDTKFVINLGNGFGGDNGFNKDNRFTQIELMLLVRELKQVPVDFVNRIESFDFQGVNGHVSAVSASTTDEMWENFCLTLMGLCRGVSSMSKIRR